MRRCSSRYLPLLLLAALASSAALGRAHAGRGATLASYKQDLVGSSLAEAVLWDLLRMENQATEDDDDERGPRRSGEAEDRGDDPPRRRSALRLAEVAGPRERKAGCKNFFWKTFTSC
ncbi:somatostatin-1-like [Syngnathoides biaculeatus]|uniref:somatostatin-1-like n=1 Tax=Syngnathoides biaculeatus TaxID=300417 RepID=UPI002ADDE9C9|nr:somatostatin-1-like [Syngnathoides biaculeatus]